MKGHPLRPCAESYAYDSLRSWICSRGTVLTPAALTPLDDTPIGASVPIDETRRAAPSFRLAMQDSERDECDPAKSDACPCAAPIPGFGENAEIVGPASTTKREPTPRIRAGRSDILEMWLQV